MPFVAASVEIGIPVVGQARLGDCGKGNAIGERVFRARSKVGAACLVADACQDESRRNMAFQMVDAGREINQRANSFGNENKAIGVPPHFHRDHNAGERRCNDDTRKLVVRHRGVAKIG